jgi:O6-methylguanine-DNA--protein-cysteine methyltransferase
LAGKNIRTVYWCERRYDQLRVCFGSSEKGAVTVGISLFKDAVDSLSYLEDELRGSVFQEGESLNAGLIEAVEAALSDRKGPEKLPLDIDATPFQMAVWRTITRIPFGSTRTYGDVARMVGSPLAARAIGQAMGRNPLPLYFP